MTAAAERGDQRPGGAAPGGVQPPVRAGGARGARSGSSTRARPLRHVHYEMTRVDRRDPDFSTTAIHGIDAVRFLAGSDYARGAVHATASGRSAAPAWPTSSWTRSWRPAPPRTSRSVRPRAWSWSGRRSTPRGHTFFLQVPMWGGDRFAGPPPALRRRTRARGRRGRRRARSRSSSAASTPSTRRSWATWPRAGRRRPACANRGSRWRWRSGSGIEKASSTHEAWLVAAPRPARGRRAAPTCPAPRRASTPGASSGPGGGGTMRRPAVSPHDPRVVVEGCDMTGAYITRDGGRQLAHVPPRLGRPTRSPSIPKDARVIYAAHRRALAQRGRGADLGDGVPRSRAQHRRARLGRSRRRRLSRPTIPLYPSGLDVNIQAVAVDPADSRRLFIASSATPPGPPGSQPTAPHDDPRLRRSRPDLGARRRAGHRAGVRDPRRRGAVARACVAETARLRGRPDAVAALRSARRAEDRSPAASDATATRRCSAYATDATAGRRTSPRTAAAPGARATARSAAMLAGDGTEAWGPAARSKPSLGPVAASADNGAHRLRRPARAARRRTARGSTASRRPATAAAPGRSCTRRPIARRTNLDPSWIETRALEDGNSVWFDAPYDLAVAPGAPDVCYATDLFRTYRTQRRRPHLGPGELRAARGRPLGEPRARRDQHLRRALGSRSTRSASS